MMQNDEDAEDTHPHAHTRIDKLCIPLGTTFELFTFYFGDISSTSPLERLLNFFAFYFSGISSASP